MEVQQTLIEEIIRKAPGFVGDTAKEYGLAYSKLIRLGTKNVEVFKKALFAIVVQRVALSEVSYKKDGNLLKPFFKNDTDAIQRTYDKSGINTDPKFQIDLPSLVLYLMLLESEPLRIILEKSDNDFIHTCLKVVHQEVKHACLHQVKSEEKEFCDKHIELIKPFLVKNRSAGQHNFQNDLSNMINNFFGIGKVDLTKEK